MSKQSIPTSMVPEITIEQVAGNLQVRGWESPEVEVRASSDDLRMQEQDDVIRLSCSGNCDVRLPHGAILRVETIGGNAQFRFLEDELVAGQVHGSLSLREVAGARVESVSGDFSARAIAGDLQVERVHGNAHVRDVQGKCVLEKVDGNLDLRDVEDDIQAEAKGNARLRLGLMLGVEYQIEASGNIHCQVPEDASLKCSLSSGAKIIRVMCAADSRTIQQAAYEFNLGAGENSLQLSANGLLYLICQGGWDEAESESPEDFVRMGDLSEQIARQVETQMEIMSRQITEQMASLSDKIGKSGFSPEETERIMERARQTSERESVRAQEKMRRAQEKLERKLEAARRHRESHAADRRTRASGKQSWSFDWAPPSPPSPPAQEPVSEEERLLILRMLEQKKISLEEADQLLSALEGKEE